MAFTLPTAKDNCAISRGVGDPKWLADINSPSNTGTKSQGNLPSTGVATEYDNNVNAATKGYAKEFENGQTPVYDVSTDTKLMLWHNQYNAPNRIQIDSVANGGLIIRIYSGTGAPPTVYRDFYVGGNDTPNAECIKGQYPLAIDLNDNSHDASNGTFDNTNITSFAILTTRANLAGTSTNWNYQAKLYVLDTTKTSSNTPTFTGTSSFSDAVTLLQGTSYTNKLGSWIRQIGDVIFIDMPFRIGDNSIETDFDDEGKTIISPVANDASDPRNRLTIQAMRTYLNLRNNVADTAVFSGTWIWGTRAKFDWDQNDSAVVTFNSPIFKGMGEFTLGSSITGLATWEDVDAVIVADTGVDIDGSVFRNPNGTHLLNLTAGAMDIANMRFENYALNHAILIDIAGTYNFDNVFFDQSGTNDIETTHASGTVTINISNGGTIPTITETGAGNVVINNNVTTQITVKNAVGDPIENARVRLIVTDGANFPYNALVTLTSSGTTATATHTAHGLSTNDFITIKGANEERYNGCFQITVTGANTYTYTMTSSTTSPATGTITATFTYFNSLTNASGIVSSVNSILSNQAISGWVRKGSSAPYYQTRNISESISSISGLILNITLLSDE